MTDKTELMERLAHKVHPELTASTGKTGLMVNRARSLTTEKASSR